MSKFEDEFEIFFKQKKLKYKRNNNALLGTPDFSFKKKNNYAVLFLHGCYWHGHNCKQWKLSNVNLSRQALTIEKDLKVRRHYLNHTDDLYLRCWECDYIDNKDYQLDKMYRAIIDFQSL